MSSVILAHPFALRGYNSAMPKKESGPTFGCWQDLDIRIVSLRRMEYDRQQALGENGEHSNREYHWQWVVTGHWRRQPYRDGVYKNIFIEAYVKGPENCPLKPPTHKIYVAVR